MTNRIYVSQFENKSKRIHVINQLIERNVNYTASGEDIESLSYKELIKQLAITKARNS